MCFFAFLSVQSFFQKCVFLLQFGDLCEKEFGAEKASPGRVPVQRCELCTFSVPFKQDIFPKLQIAFQGVRLRVPVDVECREDLHEMQDAVKDGHHNYFAKRTAEGHSDRCTALALAVRAASFGGGYDEISTNNLTGGYNP